MNRRSLLKSTGTAVLMLGISRMGMSHEGHDAQSTADHLIIESGSGQLVTKDFAHHHHYLQIPLNTIQNPPREGVKIKTGWAQFKNPLANFGKHFHSVVLSYDQLVAVSQGEVIVVEDTVKDHKYTIRLV